MSKSNEDLFDMIGCIGKDTITGFEGMVIALVNHLYGCHHYHLQPVELVDGKLAETEGFDVQRIKYIKRLVQDPMIIKSKISLGSKAKDTVTGAEGIVAGITTLMYNEPPRISLQPEKCVKGVPAETIYLSEPRLKVIAEEKPKCERAKNAPGGPCDKLQDPCNKFRV